jgi:hypothetical protein
MLDSAVCNRELRQYLLLNLFASSLFVNKGCDEEKVLLSYKVHASYAYNKWILLRKIRIISLKLDTTDICTGEFENLLTKKLQSLTLGYHREQMRTSRVEIGSEKSCCLRLISTKCSELRNLEISFDTFNNNEFERIKFIQNNIYLQSVKFSNDRSLSGECLQAISKWCVNIEKIHFIFITTDNYSAIQIINVLNSCKFLTFIRLENEHTGRVFRMHVTTKQNVKLCCVRLSGFHEASEAVKQELMQSLRSVNVLRLTCFKVTNAFLVSLQSLNELMCLTLDQCGDLFSSVCLIELISHCNKLNKIYLSGCSHFSNVELVNIFTRKGNIFEFIGISFNRYLDSSTLCAIVSAHKSTLSQIYVAGCLLILDEECDQDFYWLEAKLQLYNSNIKRCRGKSLACMGFSCTL